MSVCMSVHMHISGTKIFTKFSAHGTYGCSSVLLWQHYDKLRTSSFVDDVMFTDRINAAGNAITSVRAFVSTLTLELTDHCPWTSACE